MLKITSGLKKFLRNRLLRKMKRLQTHSEDIVIDFRMQIFKDTAVD